MTPPTALPAPASPVTAAMVRAAVATYHETLIGYPMRPGVHREWVIDQLMATSGPAMRAVLEQAVAGILAAWDARVEQAGGRAA